VSQGREIVNFRVQVWRLGADSDEFIGVTIDSFLAGIGRYLAGFLGVDVDLR
jgi:hypothetical protein